MSVLEAGIAYKPFKYPWAMEFSRLSEVSHWGEWEAKLQDDVNQWNMGKISAVEKSHITQILRLFTHSDFVVAQNYLDLFIPKFKNNEIRAMLSSFAAREFVHQKAYALLNDTLGMREEEYSAFLDFKEMKDKVDFMQSNDVSSLSGLAKALAQSICNEGMSLFSAFIMLLNYQRTGKMKGMCEIVEWSARDEQLHVSGLTELFKEFLKEHPRLVNSQFKKDIYEMYTVAVDLEDKVIDLSYSAGPIEGLEKEDVKLYIRYLANRRLNALGLKDIFEVKDNPLPWVDWVLNGNSFKNFFEGAVTDYSANGLTGDSWGW